MLTVRHRNGTVTRIYPERVETDLPGHSTLHAAPRQDQHETAERLGYGGDIAALTRDHDPLHAWLADQLGLPASFSLREAAGEKLDRPELAWMEEEAVLALQRLIRSAGVPMPWLARL